MIKCGLVVFILDSRRVFSWGPRHQTTDARIFGWGPRHQTTDARVLVATRATKSAGRKTRLESRFWRRLEKTGAMLKVVMY